MNHSIRSKEETREIYNKRIRTYEEEIRTIKKMKRMLAILRLICFVVPLFISWYYWPSLTIVAISILAFSVVLIMLVFKDTDQTFALRKRERLILINRHEIDGIQYQTDLYDGGGIYADPLHAYASDMDLFGNDSIFQWLNRGHAEQAKKLLSAHLKNPLPASLIPEKQQSVQELSGKMEYCQQFQERAMANPLTCKTEERLRKWMDQPTGFGEPKWQWLLYVYPVCTLSITACYMWDVISFQSYIFWMIGFYMISLWISRKVTPIYEMLSMIQPEIQSLYEQLYWIEHENFDGAFLQRLKNEIKPAGADPASTSIGSLSRILKQFDLRLNMLVGFFFNLFLLWDLRQVIALHTWKKKNKTYIHRWFEVIAEMEVLISLASLRFNEPAWCFPVTDEGYFHFSGKEIGHPLIHENKRVLNDFSMSGRGQISLITGSNMAGKSTFLRTLGINSIFAMMGAPVCAESMQLSVMKLASSMRVADNLAENTSTFYAELKKLKFIIDLVNDKQEIFILLDEVLRGTNSTDRHKGAQALLRQLLESGAVAVMATHDTDLAQSESGNPSVANYHFDGIVRDQDLFFDYKIKNGICESLNATALMKKIGIHFQE